MSENLKEVESVPMSSIKAGSHEEESSDKVLRILILEDTPSDADLIEYELQDAGLVFTALRVQTETEYVHALQKFSPDIIISDYDLPQYNGSLALAEAKARCPEVPFILVTGALPEDRAIDSLKDGGKDYVMKDHLRKLAPAIKRALGEMSEIRARKEAEEELRKARHKLEIRAEIEKVDLQSKTEKSKQAERALIKLLYELELKKRM